MKKHNTVVFRFPKIIALLIVFARAVLQKMTSNAWFPNPDPPLGLVEQHVDKLEDAEATVKIGGKGAAEARNVALKVVIDDLRGLGAYVYKVASQNPGNEGLIIESAGFFQRRPSKYHKPTLAAYLGPSAHEIRLEAKAVKKGAAYEWQVSMDGGATWVALAATPVAKSKLTGTTPGTTYAFRFRTTRKGVTTDWSSPVTITAL